MANMRFYNSPTLNINVHSRYFANLPKRVAHRITSMSHRAASSDRLTGSSGSAVSFAHIAIPL